MPDVRNQAKAAESDAVRGVPAVTEHQTGIEGSGATGQDRNDKNPYIQGARGLFCLFVYIYHIHHSGLRTFPILDLPIPMFILGSLEHGVELFFGISGLVILGSLLRKRRAGLFMWDRISRLFPVLWASTILTLAVMLVTSMPVPSTYTIVGSLLVLPPFFGVDPVNPIAWTLAFEMMLYWYCALVWRIRLNPILVSVAAVAAAVALVCYPRTMMMLAGAVVFYFFQKPTAIDRIARHSLFFLVAYLLGIRGLVVAAGGFVDALQPLTLPPAKGILLELGIIAVTAIGVVALVGIVRGYGLLGRLLSSRVFVGLGTISYSFYLWHIPIIAAGKRVLQALHLANTEYSQALLLLLTLPLALIVAKLSYEILEARISVWLRHFFRVPARTVSAKASASADT